MKSIMSIIANTVGLRILSVRVLRMLVSAATPKIARIIRSQLEAVVKVVEQTKTEADDVLLDALLQIFDMADVEACEGDAERRVQKHFGVIQDHGISLNDDLEIEAQSNGQ